MAEENTSNKKPVYKKWWFWIIVVFIAIGVISQNKDEGKRLVETILQPKLQPRIQKKSSKLEM